MKIIISDDFDNPIHTLVSDDSKVIAAFLRAVAETLSPQEPIRPKRAIEMHMEGKS